MRSNIARTESAGSVPEPAAIRRLAGLARGARRLDALRPPLAQGRQERHERGLLLLRQPGEGGHRRRRVLQGAADGAGLQLRADGREVRAGPVVAVLADLVAGEAAGLGGHELALL